ncbi:amidohydrolase [Subtercola sp. Z020]|uniref:amidohydrolase family protein n=1 Tax=Subtercola sp. Z020 TaxID=2080582 RepID=UPI0018EC361A|nr:amidohydrolase family protein [Subtercola sp. Z020]
MNGAIDAHVHLWNRATDPQDWIDPLTMGAIDRDFGLAELAGMLDATGVSRAVVVQSSNSLAETLRLLELAAIDPRILGVVGWLDLTADVPAQLAGIPAAHREHLVGVRHLVHIDDDEEWLGRADVNVGLDHLGEAGLAFDLVVRWWQLPLAAKTASRHPGVRFVLDHLGGVPAETGAPGEPDRVAWRDGLRALAGQPNTVAKVSGVSGLLDAGTSRDELDRLVDIAVDAFGADRLMFGSDWPLVELAAGAAGWRQIVDRQVEGWGWAPDARQNLLEGTALRSYRPDSTLRNHHTDTTDGSLR